MKILKYLSLVFVVAMIVSCEKHEFEYETTPVIDMAEFQLHYMVPVTAVAANNITKVEINNKLYANSKAPLTTYNAIPSGTVARFYTVNPGNVNIKLYQGTAETLVYDKNVTLTKGKQNIFVHDFAQQPVIFNNGYPYTSNITMDTDSTCWLKFYNFLYETAGVPTDLRLQYQYIDHRTNEAINIGQPIAFGETTGWQSVKVIKTDFNSAGSRLLTFKIKVVDVNGNITGDLQVRNTGGSMVNYNATATCAIGRRYHHTLAGLRSAAPVSSVRILTAL